MSTHCPECDNKLEPFSVHCDRCGWELAKTINGGEREAAEFKMAFDLAIEQTMRSIESGETDKALQLAETAIHVSENDRQRGEALALRGYLFLKKGESIRAESHCSEAISLGWSDHRVHAWRAAARGQQNRWALAVDDLKMAGNRNRSGARRYSAFELDYLQRANEWLTPRINSEPDNAELWFERGWVRLNCGDRAVAGEDLKRCLDLNPAHQRAALGMAKIALAQKDYRRSVEWADRAGRSDDPSTRISALRCRARANYQLGRKVEMRNDMASLKQLAGDSPPMLLAHAKLRAELGDIPLALGDLARLLEQQPECAEAYGMKGQLYAELGNHRTAIDRLERALAINPDEPEWLVDLGKSRAAIGQTEKAMEAFVAARNMDPNLTEAYIGQARMYLATQTFDEALSAIDRAISIDDHRAEGHGVRGQIRFGLCEYRESVEDFSRAIELAEDRKTRADLHYRRGTAWHEMGELDKSLADFVASSQLDPDMAGTWVWRAAVHSRLQRWNETVADLQQVMRFRSDQARGYLTLARPVAQRCIDYFSRRIQRSENPDVALFRNRGLAHEFLGNIFQAVEDYRQVLEVERGDAFVGLRLAKLLQQLDQHASAVEYLSRVIRRDRSNHAARYARAISHAAGNDHVRAMSDILKAIHIAPEIARYRLLRGELRLKTGHLNRARQDFDHAIWLDSNDPAVWQSRARLYIKAGLFEQAVRDLSRASDLAGEPVDLLVRRGEVLLRTGNPEKALQDFDTCVRKAPGNRKAVTGRARALAALGRSQEALIWLTKSLHRFSEPLDMASVLLARGKVFYRMGASSCAISDFSTILKIVSGDTDAEGTARFARALASIQHGDHESAARDIKKFLLYHPDHKGGLQIQAWLVSRKGEPPVAVVKPGKSLRMDRPRVKRSAVRIERDTSGWVARAPYDTWVVRNEENQEYGPVPKAVLDKWVEQGRIEAGMKLLRGDWSRWKRAEKVYLDLRDHAHAG